MKIRNKIMSALAVTGLAAGAVVLPTVAAPADSGAVESASAATNKWGKLCYVESYYANAARTKMMVKEYRIYLTPGTRSYGGCYLHRQYVSNGVPWAVS